ncbi:unnamed protein product [Penicillium palitans]
MSISNPCGRILFATAPTGSLRFKPSVSPKTDDAILDTTSVAYATSLGSACTVSRVRDSLPENDYILGVTFDHDSVTANAVYNSSHSDGTFFPDATIDFCNVTFSYTHSGLDQTVIVGYYLPSPDNFQNRFLATGGGAYAI